MKKFLFVLLVTYSFITNCSDSDASNDYHSSNYASDSDDSRLTQENKRLLKTIGSLNKAVKVIDQHTDAIHRQAHQIGRLTAEVARQGQQIATTTTEVARLRAIMTEMQTDYAFVLTPIRRDKINERLTYLEKDTTQLKESLALKVSDTATTPTKDDRQPKITKYFAPVRTVDISTTLPSPYISKKRKFSNASSSGPSVISPIILEAWKKARQENGFTE